MEVGFAIGLIGVGLLLFVNVARGALFIRSSRQAIVDMVMLSGVAKGDKVIDLGSGDGALVIAFARAGACVEGYEINPFLVWFSRRNIQKAGVSNLATIHWGDFWSVQFSSFDVVAVFGISFIMKKLEQTLQRQLEANARVVSNMFPFPTWRHIRKHGSVYLYKKQ